MRYEKLREPGSPAEQYAVDHSAGMYLLGPNGRYLRKFAYAMPPAEITERIHELIAQSRYRPGGWPAPPLGEDSAAPHRFPTFTWRTAHEIRFACPDLAPTPSASAAETLSCPQLTTALQVGNCPDENELQYTFTGYCSDDWRHSTASRRSTKKQRGAYFW